jgi:hypothetical protein
MELDFSNRKGFYFSFDAFLAFTVMAASLAVVSQSSFISSSSFDAATVDYREANIAGKDAMKLASTQSFSSFNETFQQELVEETVMEEQDMDRTVVDGITLLWAARNFSYAEEATRRYFDRKVPEGYGYRLQVDSEGGTRDIYSTSLVPEDSSSVASISRLVSGHQIDRPSEGVQARARATSFTKNDTRIISMPPLGMAPTNSKMEVRKEFWLNGTEDIYNGTFYLSVHYSGASYFEQFKINGNQYGQNAFDWIHEDDSGQGSAAYGTLDLTDELQEGKNTMYIRMKGGNDYNSHFHPGTKLEIDYRSDENSIEGGELQHERVYLEDILSEGSGNSEAGIFSVKQFTVPENTEFVNATYNLEVEGLDSECGYQSLFSRQPGWDVQVNLNEQQIFAECASGDLRREINLDDSIVRNGTNVVTTFVESRGDTRWGGSQTRLLSNFSSLNSSYIDLWYRRPENELRFGEIRVTASEKVGGGVKEPKDYYKEFEYTDLESGSLYIAQLFSTNPEVSVDDGLSEDTIFSSSSARSAPTDIYIGKDYLNTENQNRIRMDDVNGDPARAYLPESTFEWTVWTPSQVGYGSLFENRSAAVNDAESRLEKVLGPFVNATGISTDSVSTGNQPYLWGPASVELVIWDE